MTESERNDPENAPENAPESARSERRSAEVRRVLERYLIEVVETWSLCPWAYGSRQRDEVRLQILWGASCELAVACAAARQVLATPGTRVAMLVFPELAGGARAIEVLRDAVAMRLPEAGVAAFGPGASFDLGSPAKLVPLLRRSPDPMLQLVPFTVLDEVKRQFRPLELAEQVRALAGRGAAPSANDSLADSIAERNHAAVAPDGAQQLLRTLAEIARDRATSYPRAGIHIAS